jgi:hypothetical protein
MADDKRLASDVLLDIESKIKFIEGSVKNNDMLLKQIWNVLIPMLDNISKSLQKVNSAPIVVPSETQAVVVPKKSKLSVEAVDSLVPQKQKKKEDKGLVGKVGVNQLVQYSDGKRVMYAEVKIFDMNDTCVVSTKTTTAGRWMADLLSGKYKVVISKSKPKIDMSYEIDVESSSNNLELDPIGVV